MKAIILTDFGAPDVLQLQAVPQPVPQANEVLVRVQATSVNFGDLLVRNFKSVSPRQFSMPALFWIPTRLSFGIRKPRVKILGSEFAGEVEAVGPGVTRFKPGDAVFGFRGQSMGAYAEYVGIKETGILAPKPANLSFEEAAGIPGGAITALSHLQKLGVQPGQRILINGASGSIGSAAIQLAKHFGLEVTAVASTAGLDLLRALGADHVVDYTREDFTRNGKTYDLIYDVMNRSTFARVQGSLTPTGRYVLVSFKMKQVWQMLRTRGGSGKKVVCVLSDETQDNLMFIKDLIEAGQYRSIIDRCYPLAQAADAHRYMEGGHKRGQVILTV